VLGAQLGKVSEDLCFAHSAGEAFKYVADGDACPDTAVFLTAPQRKAIIAAASPEVAPFLRGLELTGARPMELASASVADFDGEAALRLAHRKGRPPRLRVRRVILSKDGLEFFKIHTSGKRATEPIFSEDGAQRWRRHTWSRAINRAIELHNAKAEEGDGVPEAATAYSFRHARISELLQIHGVDPLTVAAQTGTSLAMIEKAYLKFIPSAFRAKLAGLREPA
jgi:integrase